MKQVPPAKLIESYLGWLRSELEAQVLGNSVRLTTPFLDRHNDHLEIYVDRSGDELTISDDGYILSDLAASGVELDTDARKELLQTTLNGFGVQLVEGELVVTASPDRLGQQVHMLLQGMLAVNDMYVLAKARVARMFWQDVAKFFDENSVRYSRSLFVAGKSGYQHHVDFVIPKSAQQPERLVQTLTTPTKANVEKLIFVMGEVSEARGPAQSIAFINDAEASPSKSHLQALRSYKILPIVWGDRQTHVKLLAS